MSSGPSRSNRPSVDEALDAAVDAILAAVPAAASVVLLDGRSGAGKTTLAARLTVRWPHPLAVLALDDVYPGWDGLDDGVEHVRESVLVPRRAGLHAAWRRWGWAESAPAEWHPVDPTTALLVEGSGILTPATAASADFSIWVDAADDERRRRALDRDGDLYRPHWERWARQEERHLMRDHPASLADLRIALG